MSAKAPCIRCGADVRGQTAVALLVEVLEDGRVIERRTFFSLHPSCAAIKRDAVLRWTEYRHKRREVEIRWRTATLEPGAPWIDAV